ncbi:hypothetical protein LZ30DRAFT_185810 [Colletotrichum cereale]|nr:hypothetical protein LZ30DRAFT_185810 [Colletotrichum cereale]
MHRPQLFSIAAVLNLLPASSLASVHRLRADAISTRDTSCGNLTNVPLSSDPDHSTYTFILDPSVEDFVKSTSTSTANLNTLQLMQICDNPKNDIDDVRTMNFAFAKLDKFGPQTPYIMATDRCENGDSRQPVMYQVKLCAGADDGSSCLDPSPVDIACGPSDQDNDVIGARSLCPVSETKAINLTDPTPWVCRVCKDRFCSE